EPPPVTQVAQLDALLAKAMASATPETEGDDAKAKEEPETPPPLSDEEHLTRYYHKALSEESILATYARECLEDLGMFGLMRRQGRGEPWWSSGRIEKRLLRRVDALIACGVDRLPRLIEMLVERPIADPDMTWAILFLFGSIAGNDAWNYFSLV